MTEILDFAKDGQYQLACAKYFEVMHNKPASKPLLHPNAYFVESRAILAEEDGDKGTKKMNENFLRRNVSAFALLTINLFADIDNKEKFSQSLVGTPGSLSSKRSDRYPTPSRNTEFTGTPKRNDKYVTPTRNADTIDTPLRKNQRLSYQTPSKKNKMTPVNIAEMLNDDDFAEFMDVDINQS